MTPSLQLDYLDSNDLKTFRLIDNSLYNPKIPVDCATVEITPPGFKRPAIFSVLPAFNTVYNASLLGILKTKSYKQLTDLPDGIYHLKYSIAPVEELYVEYDYFRTVKLKDKFYRIVCGLLDKKRDYTVKAFEEIKQDILWVAQLIEAAKHKAETCCDNEKGTELYNEAVFLLNKYISCIGGQARSNR